MTSLSPPTSGSELSSPDLGSTSPTSVSERSITGPGVELDQGAVVIDPVLLDRAAIRAAGFWERSQGELALLALPTLVATHMKRLQMLGAVLGHPFSDQSLEQLREVLEQRTRDSLAISPYSMLRIRYQVAPNPQDGLIWNIQTIEVSRRDRARDFLRYRPPEQFEQFPDAKVMAVAAALGQPGIAPILDVGAGTGRNALALARRGYPVTALEDNPILVETIQERSRKTAQPLEVWQANLLDPLLNLPREKFALAIVVSVVQYFTSPAELAMAIARLTTSLRPGGYLLLDTFVTSHGYRPTPLVLELSRFSDSYLYTPEDWSRAIADQPLELVSDESAWAYETQHLEPAARAARVWLDPWATADRLFKLSPGERPPLSLRWQLYRKRS